MYTNDVTHLPMLSKSLVGFVTEVILGEVALDLSGDILQRNEARFAHYSTQHDSTGNRCDHLGFSKRCFVVGIVAR